MGYCSTSVNSPIDGEDLSLLSTIGPESLGGLGAITPEIGEISTIDALSINAISAMDGAETGLIGQITDTLSLQGSLCNCGE